MLDSPDPDEGTLRALEAATPDGRCICEIITGADGEALDYRFVWVNRNFPAATGLEDAVGRTALELVPNLERRWVDLYARVGLGRETLSFEEGSEALGRFFDVHAFPLEPAGRFGIAFRDITAKRRAQMALEAEVERSRRLLEELNHRVMNTLALIGSILRMEARSIGEGGEAEALRRVRLRVDAVAGLYRQLSEASAENSVAADAYLTRLVAQLEDGLGDGGRVRITCAAEPLELPTRLAVSIGLIVTELATNSLKYAFPCGRCGIVEVSLRRGDAGLELCVADDGAGIGPLPGGGTGLGERLIAAFVGEMGAERVVESGPHGTRTRIAIPAAALDAA